MLKLTLVGGPTAVIEYAGLLSHEHHSDNLDPAGREFLPHASRGGETVTA